MAKSSKSGSDAGVFSAEDVAEQGFEAPSSMLQGGGVQGQIPPNNYAGLAWCSCFFCCWPIGLYAIITSNSVYSKWQSGDYQGAKEASETTRQASIASICIGTILFLLYMLTAGSATSGSHP
ncbi:unnamed protein product [Ectocarpus sp. 13 AM-2016]